MYQPAEQAAPLQAIDTEGAVVSAVIVNVLELVRPALLWLVTVCAPLAVVLESQL